MRYRTIEEVTAKYGLTVGLDEKAPLTEWEGSLNSLLSVQRKELANVKNPSLRHKAERQCDEIAEAFKLVAQKNVFAKLQRCIAEDKQEIFEHELRKTDTQTILPPEQDPAFEDFLEIKSAARKKWTNVSFSAAAPAPPAPQPTPAPAPASPPATPTPSTSAPPDPACAVHETTAEAAPAIEKPAVAVVTTASSPASFTEAKPGPVTAASTLEASATAKPAAPVVFLSSTPASPQTHTSGSAQNPPVTAKPDPLPTASKIQSAAAPAPPPAPATAKDKTPQKTPAQPSVPQTPAPLKPQGSSRRKVLPYAIAALLLALAVFAQQAYVRYARSKNPALPTPETNLVKQEIKDTNIVPPKDSSAASPNLASTVPNSPPQQKETPSEPTKSPDTKPILPQETKVVPPPEPVPLPAPPPAPTVQLASLRVETYPRGATVRIVSGTNPPQTTPAHFNLLPGTYELTLTLGCYAPMNASVRVDPGENQPFTRNLQKLASSLNVRTEPAGARIYVDGVPRAERTPAIGVVTEPGEHTVRVELAGYRVKTATTRLPCGMQGEVDFGSLVSSTATLTVNSIPSGAAVKVNGYNTAKRTPCTLEVRAGPNTIELFGLQYYLPAERTVTVEDGDNRSFEFALLPAPVIHEQPRPIQPAANLLVWCGLDYSMARMTGTPKDFYVPEREGLGAALTEWNRLFTREMLPQLKRMAEVADSGGRRSRRDALVSDARSFTSDIGSVEARNGRVTANHIDAGAGAPDQLIPGSSVSDADIAGAVRSYRLQADSGLGLVFIMDRLVTSKERGFQDKGCLYVVFFDIGSRRVLSSERLCERPGGTRPSHYWFNPIKEAVKKLPPLYTQVASR